MNPQESSPKKRFFFEDLEEDLSGKALRNEESLLFGGHRPAPENPVSEKDEVSEIRDVIPDLSHSQAEMLLLKCESCADRSERISNAVSIYFENQSQKERSVPEANMPLITSPKVNSNFGVTKKKDYGTRLTKKPKPSVQWRRFIGSIQVSALATRPTVQPLKYGCELQIVCAHSEESASRLFNGNGRKRTSMANFVRLVDAERNREVGRVPENVARIVLPLIDFDDVEFEATMIFCDNKRLSVGDSFVVQLDIFLTSVLFEKKPKSYNYDSREKISYSQSNVESEDEARSRARRIALLGLFDEVNMVSIDDSTSEDNEVFEDQTQVIDLGNYDDDNDNETSSITPEPKQEDQLTESDTLNLNQLKSIYRATLSTDSTRFLPETTPSEDDFALTLRKYQKQGLTWMLRKEREFDLAAAGDSSNQFDEAKMNPLWKKFKWPKDLAWGAQRLLNNLQEQQNACNGAFFYANLHTGEFSKEKPILKSVKRGGILADEMGLGKTISVLSLILTVPSDREFINQSQNFVAEARNSDSSIITSSLQSSTEMSKEDYAFATTLIVVPMSLLSQWQQEFEKANRNSNIKCEVYYGNSITNLKTLLTKTTQPPSILLTTYGTVQHEWSKELGRSRGTRELTRTNGLFSVEFFRIVIDEGHTIRNRSTRTSKAVMDLAACRRWILTGTPIINKLDDLYSAVKFLRLEPWSQAGYWKSLVSDPFEVKQYKQAFDMVSTILDPVILRRTKLMRDADGKKLVELPNKEVLIEKVKFNRNEDEVYKFFLNRAESSVMEGLARGDLLRKYSTILVHILRLRQVCCHLDLLGSKDENDADLNGKQLCQPFDLKNVLSRNFKESTRNFDERSFQNAVVHIRHKYSDDSELKSLECSVCTADPIEPINQIVFTECGHAFCQNCIMDFINFQTSRKQDLKCPNCRTFINPHHLLSVAESGSKLDLKRFDDSSYSSKVQALMKNLSRLQEASSGEQVVVFSQFSSYLDILERELGSNFGDKEAKIYKLDGRLSLKERTTVLKNFANKDPARLKILLLSLKAGGVGLNLTCASRAYMMDPWWSPSLEDQAIDRVHRIGQQNDVKVIRFIMENSIEEKMLRIQERKRTLGEAVDADEDERKRRRVDEIRMLFE
ncbi:LAMI_0G00188g1_1 [Lachancea mirantina]|uniref:DNA repair protein RAD5 n=1 Tax=Lachancea mirantina TaxID=1230905 RepID=A0A1G4K730_9SACH|nr:LAMI_0G00188g1_1 [Lachancea mirantina]